MDSVASVPMKTWRIWLVLGVAAVITFGHLYDIITKTEQWPFSYYPMYARAEKKRVQHVISLFAVIKRDGKRQVVRVTDAPDIPQIAALNEGRLRVILMSAWNRPPGNNEAAAKQVLADYIRLYESRRHTGEIDGPKILEARLYKLTWKLRADGSRTKKPTATELLASVPATEVFK
jgi:hypothetical protein